MNEKHQGKVHYVCFYSEPQVENRITTYPSVISKIDYIVDTIKAANRKVEIVSIAPAKNGWFRGYRRQVDSQEMRIYLPSVVHENRLLSKACFVVNNAVILLHLLKSVKKEDAVLVYHSLYNRLWLNLYKHLFRGNLIVQIEDVFSELTAETKKYQKLEWKLLQSMKKCICVNDFVCKKLQSVPQKIVSYGSYFLPPKYETVKHDQCRLVYAGVIEQERKAAFLAIEAMRHLSEKYELSILGFGKEEDIRAMEELLAEVNNQLGRAAVVFCGKRSGEEYWRFLQSCDIALSTHAYTEDSLSSANHTFPSKVLTYLANGLPVVAQRLEVLEISSISDFLSFYDEPTPEKIAEAILSVDIEHGADPRKKIESLNRSFKQKMEELLSDV